MFFYNSPHDSLRANSRDIRHALAQVTTAVTSTPGAGNLGTTVQPVGTRRSRSPVRNRPGGGTNLFHSSGQFNVGRVSTAQFLNTTPSLQTDNILSRVTGGNPSNIFGTIDTMSYPGANLFLMNPAGIVFGPSATLNVGGSVAFTTADYLRLAKRWLKYAGIFHADTTATSLLTSASIAAFGFLGPNPEAIAVQGSRLTVQPVNRFPLSGVTSLFSPVSLQTVPSDRPLSAPGVRSKSLVSRHREMLAETLGKAPNMNGTIVWRAG